MSPRRDDGRDDELAELLSDLESTLGDLRRELDARDGRGPTDRERDRYGYRPPEGRGNRDEERRPEGRRRGRRGRRRESPLPRPPSVGELLRFTEEYTIPTVVATLEATIRSLELLRRALRLADPGRSAFGDADEQGPSGRRGFLGDDRTAVDRLAGSRMGRDALGGLDAALSEMRTALSEADLPEDEESRSVLEDARGLVAEIEARIDEAERRRRDSDAEGRRDNDAESRRESDATGRDAREDRTRGRSESVTIDVTDGEADDDGTDDDAAEAEPEDDAPQVDVEAELESIRREIRGESASTEASDAEPPGGEDEDESDADGESESSAGDEGGNETDSDDTDR